MVSIYSIVQFVTISIPLILRASSGFPRKWRRKKLCTVLNARSSFRVLDHSVRSFCAIVRVVQERWESPFMTTLHSRRALIYKVNNHHHYTRPRVLTHILMSVCERRAFRDISEKWQDETKRKILLDAQAEFLGSSCSPLIRRNQRRTKVEAEKKAAAHFRL